MRLCPKIYYILWLRPSLTVFRLKDNPDVSTPKLQSRTFQPQTFRGDWGCAIYDISSGNYEIIVQFQSQLSRPSLANQNTVLPRASQRGEINGWNFECLAETNKVFSLQDFLGLKVPTTPITAMGCRQCLPLSVVQLKDKHCRKPHCSNRVVDTLGLGNYHCSKWHEMHAC